jgi:hypothetical protein
MVMSRGPGWRHSSGAAGAGFALVYTSISAFLSYWVAQQPSPGHPGPRNFGLVLLAGWSIAILLWGVGLRTLLVQEEWEGRPGLLTTRKRLLGAWRAREFRHGTFLIRPYNDDHGRRWRLSVKAGGAATLIAGAHGSDHWSETELGILARALGEATGFPVEDEEGTIHRFGNRLTSTGK